MAGGDTPDDVICDGDVCRRVTPEEKAAFEAAKANGAASSSSPLTDLLGDNLLRGKATVPIAQVTGPGKVIGLYFSAHWCPPCRAFTPHLASIYKRFKELHPQRENWEIIFVSSDRDQGSFEEYFAQMPWLALPFEARDLKARLSQKFKVRGIPTLVILDAETGEVITANGREVVDDDAECADFPWRPKPLSEVIAGPLVDRDGKEVSATDALAGKVTLLYFSAHWCGPCRRFTPELVKTYGKLKAAGRAVEVVFVSGDRNDADFKEYLSEMPWLAVPRSDAARISALNRAFEVDGIPTLVVLDEQLALVTKEGRGAVGADPEGADFPWRPKPVERLTDFTVSAINEQPVALLVLGGDDADAAAARALDALTPAATSADGKGVKFLWALHSDDLAGRVLGFLHEEPRNPEAPEDMLVLVDVPEQVSYKTNLRGDAVTPDAVLAVTLAYRSGGLRTRPLGQEDE